MLNVSQPTFSDVAFVKTGPQFMKASSLSASRFDLSEQDLLHSSVVIIPTYNAVSHWGRLNAGLQKQRMPREQILIVDSSSCDQTQQLVRKAGYQLKVIPKEEFRHGTTRQMAAQLMPKAEFLIYLTQDAIPTGKNSFLNLLRAFENPDVGAVYGRQLPREEADPIERHAREFNYPNVSSLRSFDSKDEMGMKAAFFSNSFAAYRRSALDQVGGFPMDSIVSEEVTVVARMLMEGWKIAYHADATVIHSHPLKLSEEFSRYFDIGVHHGREAWLLETFGHAGGEGLKFVRSELEYLRRVKPSMIPLALLRTFNKLCGYKLGQHESYLPHRLSSLISAQPQFWRTECESDRGLEHSIVSRL